MLEQLQSRFKLLLSKRASLALALWGEAGIGKSYTVQELLRGLPCQHRSVHASVTLSRLLTSLPRSRQLPLWTEQTLNRAQQDDILEHQQVITALATMCAALAPFVLHVEDIHEIQGERLEFIYGLANRLKRLKGVALLITSRTQVAEPFVLLRLKPLTREASHALLLNQLGATLPPDALEWIYHKAVGNPLYSLEYLRYLTRQGYLWNDGRAWHWRKPDTALIPITIEALIEQLMAQAQASPQQRYALEAKAMLPQGTDIQLWSGTARLSTRELHQATQALIQQGIFRDDDFAHPLFREVACKALSTERRQHLAKRAINVLRENPQQASWFLEDAKLAPVESIAILQQAATLAKESGNDLQVATYLARAVHYAQGEQRASLALEAARGLQHIDIQESIRLARLAVQYCPDEAAIYFLASQLITLGHSDEADRVLSLLPENSRTGINWVKRLITVNAGKAAYESVIQLWCDYPELQQDTEPDIAYAVAFALVILNKFSEAETLACQVLQRVSSAFDRCRLLIVRGLAQLYSNNFSAAEACFNEAFTLAVSHHLKSWQAVTLHNRSILYEAMGRYQEMLLDIREAARLYAEYGESRRYASSQVKLARFLLEQGEYGQAEDVLLECRDLLSSGDPSPFLVTCECSLSDLYREWQPPHAAILARKHTQDALGYAQQLKHPNKIMQAQLAVAKIEAWQGKPQSVLSLSQEVVAFARQSADSANLWLALEGRAYVYEALGQLVLACSDLNEAQSLAEAAGDVLMVRRLSLELARLSGDHNSACDHLKWFEDQGFMHGANLAKRYFPELDTKQTTEAIPATNRLELLGSVRLLVGGNVNPLRGQKRKQLLAKLLEARIAGRSEVSQLELIDTLYPNEPEDVALTALKQLVFQLRKAIGTGLVLRSSSGYTLGQLSSDVEDFLQMGNTELWRGCYCEDLEMVDERIATVLYETLYIRASELLKTDPGESYRLGQLLLDYDPYNRQALHLSLEALKVQERKAELGKLYESSRITFAELGEVLPQHWAEFLSH